MKANKGLIEQQYQNLKHKVQTQIQALQTKLANTEIHYHRTINPNPNHAKILLEPSTCTQYQHNRPNNHEHSRHHHHNCHNHSTHSAHSCSNAHFGGHCGGQCRSRKSSSSIHTDQITSPNSRTYHMPVSTILQPPTHPPVNIPLVNTKILEHNLFLEQAFIKSMHTQQEMAQNMRLLQEKIAKLQNNPSSNFIKSNNNSEQSQNQYQFRTNSSGSDQVTSRSMASNRCRTNYEREQVHRNGQGFNIVLNEYSRGKWENLVSDEVEEERMNSKKDRGGNSRGRNGSMSKVKSSCSIKSKRNVNSSKKIKSSKTISMSKNLKPSSINQNNPSSRTNNEYLLLPNQQYHPKTAVLSPKSNTIHIYKSSNKKTLQPLLINNQQWSDYYNADRLCPVHINPAEIRLRSKDKEVYVDSQHRNRKHQRDHLVESFKQQDNSRKKLIDKIVKSSGMAVSLTNK